MMKEQPLAPAHYVAGVCAMGFLVALYLLSAGRTRFATLSAS
jgi:hypothetical protein